MLARSRKTDKENQAEVIAPGIIQSQKFESYFHQLLLKAVTKMHQFQEERTWIISLDGVVLLSH